MCNHNVRKTKTDKVDTFVTAKTEIANIVIRLHSVIMTIPGIGSTNGRMILGEIGVIHHFSTPGKLLAFAGLDLSVYQFRFFDLS